MKLVASGALALALVGALGYFSEPQVSEMAEALGEQKTAFQEEAVSEFTLMGVGLSGVCRVRHAPGLENTQLDLDGNCARLLPRLAEARIWEEREDGTVAFVSATGEALVEFYPGDGAAYESLRPQTPLLSMYPGH
ncbi:hypothetical protein ACFPOD_08595 [Nitratireductor kimnyeongensis]|uniref:Alkaline proteinase inhibitor/ Outer membrane lipoprotein Omp19 domain-containing protein n=1 Tax=Nitratireductor kimnyeongensis TaxID=430679 RepID=A0ABW0T7L4_9HYPH|nr:hypothetical protein [Nitratireductor kimnyeongensis]QZZ36347.1 hypothetical protein KW403_04160 [Nitratireductor kimnyeongensis]